LKQSRSRFPAFLFAGGYEAAGKDFVGVQYTFLTRINVDAR
jgi:hypothetical protein